MTECYLATLPHASMRGLAGFDVTDTKPYFVPRATVTPPRELLCQIWPELDAWITAFKDPEENDVETTMAADGVLELLTWLREMVLQDAVGMRKHFPTHPIFSEPVFHTTEFDSFAALVERVCEDAPVENYHAVVGKASSAVTNALRDVQLQQAYLGREMVALKEDCSKRFERLERKLNALMD